MIGSGLELIRFPELFWYLIQAAGFNTYGTESRINSRKYKPVFQFRIASTDPESLSSADPDPDPDSNCVEFLNFFSFLKIFKIQALIEKENLDQDKNKTFNSF